MAAGPTTQDAASIEELFRETGALLDGHFLLKSGGHSPVYLEKFLVLQHPSVAVEIGRRLAGALAPSEPTVVVGPTTGGVLLAHEVARQLEAILERPMRALFAEPIASGGRALRRGFAIGADDRVVLVDDILTTGTSLVETIAAVRDAGGEPLAAAVIADRSTRPVELGIPLLPLARMEAESYEATSCPLCAAGEPLVKRGSSA